MAWGGVGFGRVGKGRVGLGLGVGVGVYMRLGKVGSVGLGGMWVWVDSVLPPPNPNFTLPTQPHLHSYHHFTPTLSTSTLPYPTS